MKILLVEDNEDDAFLVERAFNALGRNPPVHICKNGREAVAYLTRSEPFRDAQKYPLPSLLITDIKMPESSGLELIRILRENGWKELPVTVLSSSAEKRDVSEAYRLGANVYLEKPGEFHRLVASMKKLLEFWESAALPEPREPFR